MRIKQFTASTLFTSLLLSTPADCLLLNTLPAMTPHSDESHDHQLMQTEAETETEFLGKVMGAVSGAMGGGGAGGGDAPPPPPPPPKQYGAPINVIDNSRGSSPLGGGGGGFGGGYGGAYGGMPPMMMPGGLPMGGFGNLGMDSDYLNPILEQRIEFLRRQIARYTKKPMSTEPLQAEASEAPAEE